MGRAVFSAEVDVGPLADMLTSYGFLQEWDDADRSKVEAAFREWVTAAYRYE
jgi:hypothetical protein